MCDCLSRRLCVCVFFWKRVESINSLMKAVFCEVMCVCVFFFNELFCFILFDIVAVFE